MVTAYMEYIAPDTMNKGVSIMLPTWINEILLLIERYGLSVVLLVGAIVAWVFTIQWLQKKFDNLWDLFLDRIPQKESEKVENILLLNANIKACLSQTMAELDCDWAQLWQFHNGTHGVGRPKIPFMFVSMTHEVCKDNCESTQRTICNLPLAFFDTILEKIISTEARSNEFHIELKKESLEQLLKSYGAKIGFIRVIRDENKNLIGFITCAWKTNRTLTERKGSAFLNGAQQMAAILAAFPDDKTKMK